MKLEGYIFAPKAFYGTLTEKSGSIQDLRHSKAPKKISRLIVPGFISTHVHTVQTGARNFAENMELLDWLSKVIWPYEARLTERTTYQAALTGMNECLRNGITTILDMATTRHTAKVFEAARDSGIRAFIGKALMDRGPKSLIDKSPLDEVFELLDRWHSQERGRLHVTLCPRFVLSCSEPLLKKVATLSEDFQLLNHTHASENLKECEWIEKNLGSSNIGYLDQVNNLSPRTIIAHGVHLSQRDLQLIRKSKSSISHCPTSNLKLASGIADVKAMTGINVSLGVDGAPCNNILDPMFEMRLAHLLSRHLHGLNGISAKRVFEMSTISGAKALRQEKRIGSIELHKEADLLVFRVPESIWFNPKFPYESLIHSLTAANIEKVYVRGVQLEV